jgi:hypothetical protein
MRICRTRSCIFNSTFLVVYRETKLRIFCYRKIYFHSLKHNIFSPQSFYRTFELWVYVCGFLFSDFWSLKKYVFQNFHKREHWYGVQVLRFFILWDTLYLLSCVLVHHLYRETACRKIHLERKLTWAFYFKSAKITFWSLNFFGKNMYIYIMMYTSIVRHFNMRYIVLWATQKRQNLTEFECAL